MENIKATEGDLVVRDAHFGIVAARFNDFIVDSLLAASVRCLQKHGAVDADIEIIRVPGAFEMPLAVDKLAASRRCDGIIALGAVIRGGTPHFDYVAGECSRGLAQVALKHELPVIFGVLTTDDVDQALERAGSGAGNKGFDTAIAALQMISVLDRIHAE